MIIKNLDGKKEGKHKKPAFLKHPVRTDLIKRAYHAEKSEQRQPYGANPDAGNRHSTYLSKKRREYRGTYGIGQSRVPRKVMSSQGTQFQWMGAEASGTVGGRRAHAPKASKKWEQKINKKERKKALASALSATTTQHTNKKQAAPETYPFILTEDFNELTKTKEVYQALQNLGLEEELERTKQKKIRAGKGKMRGRKYKRKVGPLILAPKDATIHRAARNIPGITTKTPESLSILDVAPGSHPGRILLTTKETLKQLEEKLQ